MAIYAIWESRFPAETAEEGIRVTKAIWGDMICFDGYLSHELIQVSTSRASLRRRPSGEPRSR